MAKVNVNTEENIVTVLADGTTKTVKVTDASQNRIIKVQTPGPQGIPGRDGSSFAGTLSGSLNVSGSFNLVGDAHITGGINSSAGFTGSLLGTASYAVSSSHALTASYALNAASANSFPFTGSAIISGSLSVTGSVNVTAGITGSLFGTASFANTATSAATASYVLASAVQGLNLSQITSGSATASITPTKFSVNVNTEITGALNITAGITGSLFGTSSWANNSLTASYVEYSNVANRPTLFSGSSQVQLSGISGTTFADTLYTFPGDIVVQGNVTAEQLIISTSVYYVTTSFSSGSTIFGNDTSDTHQFTGSVRITGSQQISGSVTISADVTAASFTGSLLGTASYVTGSIFTGANRVTSASYSVTASYASTATVFPYTGSAIISGSLVITGSTSINAGAGSTVFALNADTLVVSGSLIVTGSTIITGSLNAPNITGSLLGTASRATTASFAISSSFSTTSSFSVTASYVSGNIFTSSNPVLSASYALTASYALNGGVTSFNTRAGAVTLQSTDISTLGAGIISSSAFTASWANNSVTASYVSGNVFNSTNPALSASFALTASYALNVGASNTFPYTGSAQITGSLGITGSLSVSGAIQLRPTKDPDPTGAITTDTFLFVSASNTALGNDLYFRQDGNLTKWKWIESQLSSGLLYGGIVTYSASFFYVSSGSGIIVQHNASTGSEVNPIVTYVKWAATTQSFNYLTTETATWIYIDSAGNVQQQITPTTATQYDTTIPLGFFGHPNKTSVSSFNYDVLPVYDNNWNLHTFAQAFGGLKMSGLNLAVQVGSLQFGYGSGEVFNYGAFYGQTPNSPSIKSYNTVATASINRVYRSATAGEFTNAGIFTSTDPTKWDDGSGTLQNVGGGNYTIQRVFLAPGGATVVYYGQNTYNTLLAATNAIGNEVFVESKITKLNSTFLGYLIVKGNTTDLSNTVENAILNSGLFRNTVGGSGGTIGVSTLDSLSDVTITSATNEQALIYQNGFWVNGNPASASFASTASYIDGGFY